METKNIRNYENKYLISDEGFVISLNYNNAKIRNKFEPYIYTTNMLSEEYGVSKTHIKNIVKFRSRNNL